MIQILLLTQVMGNGNFVNLPNSNISPNQGIELNQDFSVSDFFYSKVFLSDSNTLGGDNPKNTGISIGTDSQNNIIMGGGTTQDSFLVTTGAFQTDHSGNQDGFLSKLNENGTILWSTFLGGSDLDVVTSLAVDSQDNIVVAGYSESINFHTTTGAFQEDFGGSRDIFLMKFTSSGELIWSTYVGGEKREGNYQRNGEGKNRVLIDSNDDIIVSGTTHSDNFPTLNAYQSVNEGGLSDAFLSKFKKSGELEWSTYLGGNGSEIGSDIAVDTKDNIVIVGRTESSNFPVLSAFDSILSDEGTDAFISKFNTSGNLLWSTHQGGNLCEGGCSEAANRANTVVIDKFDQIIVGGNTDVVDNELTSGAFDRSPGGLPSGFISKYSENGTLSYASYLGKGGENHILDLHVDSNNDLLVNMLSGDKISELQNSYYSFDQVGSVTQILKFNSTNDLTWSSNFVSPSQIHLAYEITIDKQNRILITGGLRCDPDICIPDMPGLEGESSLIGDSPILQIVKLDPIDDLDSDGLLNHQEFKAKSSPNDADTDDDGLTDGDEFNLHGTDPTLADSDNDGLSDKDEIDQEYDPNNNDTDSDGMPDGWEDHFGLDPNDNLDAKIDSDFDGLINEKEFIAGTDPKEPDFDGDGMKDGYEVDNNLNPLEDDSNGDIDGDFLSNKFEHDNGLNPDSPIETIIASLVLVISISAGIYYIIRSKRLNKRAKDQGFIDRKEMKDTQERGFTSVDDLKLAETQGFKTKSAQTVVQATKQSTVILLVDVWKSQINSSEELTKSIDLDKIQELVNSTTSPINLHDVELDYKPILEELKQFQLEFDSISVMQQSISQLSLIDGELPFVNFTTDNLTTVQDKVVTGLNNMNLMLDNLMKIFEVRKQWFEPWQRLLTLIQMTQDGLPIDLAKIAEVIQGSEDQSEKLLELLLDENAMIGTYDVSERVYTKGTDISQYIQSMMEKMANFAE
ncbi:MAG: hypothetical protein GPJ54_04370 [Candidatus Heimdallarchaeota archaeon]|nr:hypothetical protein [Candidatus Heimdallarchaeota archaeon]